MSKNINDITEEIFKILSQSNPKESKNILNGSINSLKNGQPSIHLTQTKFI